MRQKSKTNLPLIDFLIFALFLLLFVFFLDLTDDYQLLDFNPQQPILRSQFLAYPSPSPYPVKNTNIDPPAVSAKSVLIIDADSWVTLYQKQANFQIAPASTAKLITALTVLDYCDPDTYLQVSNIKTEGSQINLKQGEKFKVVDLLKALLISSANDAAIALAQNCKPDNATFVEAMNQKAKSLHLDSSNFTNPTGLDGVNNFSTAYDLALVSKAAIGNILISEIVSTKSATIFNASSSSSYKLHNLNLLLDSTPGVLGIKTGTTDNAKENLITLTERDGHKIIVVLLSSTDRFTESRLMIDWAFGNFSWKNLI
jgi:D-alanyl-D-alanine carboxypeptidase (penicillin-binding protein 5/6)